MNPDFWKNRPLEHLDRNEWEALCDGCGKCCLHKIEDIDTAKIYYSSISCRYLNTDTCRCNDYKHRAKLVKDCVTLSKNNLDQAYWLPSTCAYKRLANGKDLPDWHPLVTGNKDSTFTSGNSIAGRARSETYGDDPEDFLIDWITADD